MEVYPRPDDSIIFSFSSFEDRMKVLELSPWFILGRYLHLRPWSSDIRSMKEFFGSMPLWIRLPNLPLQFWSPGPISRNASTVGKPLFLDDKSTKVSKLQFVCVCIEPSAHNPLPNSILVEVEGEVGGSNKQQVECEAHHKICSKCLAFGHTVESYDEMLKIKSTLQYKRRPAITVSPNQTNSKEPQVIVEIVSIQKNDISSKNPDSDWVIVTKKRKNQKKKAGAARKSGIQEDHDDDQEERNRVSGIMKAQGSYKGKLLHSEEHHQLENEFVVPENQSTSPLGLKDAQTENSDKIPDSLPGNQVSSFLDSEIFLEEDADPKSSCRLSRDSRDCLMPVPQDFTERDATGQVDVSAEKSALFHFEFSTSINLSATENPDVGLLQVNPSLIPNPPLDSARTQAHVPIPTSTSKFVNSQSNLDESLLPLTHNQIALSAQTQNHSLGHPSHSHDISKHFPNPTHLTTCLVDDSDDDDGFGPFPPGFTPTKEDATILRELMKEGVSSVPPEYQINFLKLVDLAEDGEIVEFFQDKFKETARDIEDTNFVTWRNLQRSHRFKKKPARFSDPTSSSGLKRGFFK